MTGLPGVHHHVLVRRRGGAAKVARLLAQAQARSPVQVLQTQATQQGQVHGQLQARTREVSYSFELDEPGSAEGEPANVFFCPPADLARLAPVSSLVHVHATARWAELLDGFAAAPRPLAVTAHDCRLLTGGCVYPVQCDGAGRGCPDPCPRGYPESGAEWTRIHRLVDRVRPALAAPSGWLARQLRQAWPELAVRVIPNAAAVSPNPPDKAAARAALGIAPAAKVVVFLAHGGDQAAYKGGARFEALWRTVKAGLPQALGIIAGGEGLSRQDDLLRLPYLEGQVLEGLLRAADVLAYPSLADNHPLVVLEAMALGLAVAAYDVGGVGEQIVSGVHGLLSPWGDEPALAGNVLRLLGDPGLTRTLTEQAAARQVRHFGLDRMVRDYDRFYSAIALKSHAGCVAARKPNPRV